MSVLAWIAFVVCSAAVALHYNTTGDTRFLLYAIPGLILLLVIPFTLAWMSRRSYMQASARFENKAHRFNVRQIDLGMTGTVVKVSGEVCKISFKWLNRPHFIIKDQEAEIRAVMFTAPANNVQVGDHVEVLGIVMKNLFKRKTPIISAVSIRKV